MPVIVEAILSLVKYAPSAITEISALYTAIKSDISATDQATIDAALADAIAHDAAATDAADSALTDAANR